MVRSSVKIFFVFLIILFSGCNIKNGYFLTQANKVLKEQKSKFGLDFYKNDLLNHFPKKIKNNNVSFWSSPPTCPPTYKCYKQYGDVFYIVNKADYQKELNILFEREIAFKSTYNDSNIIINLSNLKNNNFPVEKSNKYCANKLPIPYFESYNFGLGEKIKSKQIKDEVFESYTYTIPSDLQIYVLQAEAGNFWKVNCNENRPEALKEWQHGYSKGFAISNEEDIVIYWSMIW